MDYTFSSEDYKFAMQNTKYNDDGRAVVAKDDEWLEETEWDELFEALKSENSK